jgi:hypothetical protein
MLEEVYSHWEPSGTDQMLFEYRTEQHPSTHRPRERTSFDFHYPSASDCPYTPRL